LKELVLLICSINLIWWVIQFLKLWKRSF